MVKKRTAAAKKAKQLAKSLRPEQPDYYYLKAVFKSLREELNVKVCTKPKKLPRTPSEEELHKFYAAVWQTKNMQHMVMIKTFLYTGVRISELVNIKIRDIDFLYCQIRINQGKGKKDRVVPFPRSFKEILAMHVSYLEQKKATYMFESSWQRQYSDRGIRKILAKYTKAAGIKHAISPHKLRHFLFTWLKKQGIDDALIQPYSGHDSRRSLEIYSKLSIKEAQQEYDKVIGKFPV